MAFILSSLVNDKALIDFVIYTFESKYDSKKLMRHNEK